MKVKFFFFGFSSNATIDLVYDLTNLGNDQSFSKENGSSKDYTRRLHE